MINTFQILSKHLDSKSQIDTFLLDFSKAFDNVPHQRHQYKLQYYGISGSINRWIADYLCDRTQTVVLEGCSSDTSTVDSGVSQGSVIGPVLFILYINDLPDYITNGSYVSLFADDSILFKEIKSEQDAINLQQPLKIRNGLARVVSPTEVPSSLHNKQEKTV